MEATGFFDCLGGALLSHHKARARDNSMFVSLENSAIRSGAKPEVIGVDDEITQFCHVRLLDRLDEQAFLFTVIERDDFRPGGLAFVKSAMVHASKPGS